MNTMDYEFALDEYDRPIAEFSSGFEALGRWFSEQLRDQYSISELLMIVEQLEQRRITRRQIFSEDSHLLMTQEEVETKAMILDEEFEDELPENTHLYQDEAYARCGLQDFKQALLSWQQFVEN
jgi:uncharacterized protein YacL (UPF0231 family)